MTFSILIAILKSTIFYLKTCLHWLPDTHSPANPALAVVTAQLVPLWCHRSVWARALAMLVTSGAWCHLKWRENLFSPSRSV